MASSPIAHFPSRPASVSRNLSGHDPDFRTGTAGHATKDDQLSFALDLNSAESRDESGPAYATMSVCDLEREKRRAHAHMERGIQLAQRLRAQGARIPALLYKSIWVAYRREAEATVALASLYGCQVVPEGRTSRV